MKMVNKISTGWWILWIGLLYLGIPNISYAYNSFEPVYMSDIKRSDTVLIDQEISYPLYQINHQTFVSISTLKAMGFEITEQLGICYIHLEGVRIPSSIQPSVLSDSEPAYMVTLPIYCGNIRSYALVAREERLVPLELLEALYNIERIGNTYQLTLSIQNGLPLIRKDETAILNLSDHLMQLEMRHVYWNGVGFDMIHEKILLEPSQQQKWVPNGKGVYITTLFDRVNEWGCEDLSHTGYGQINQEIFTQYSRSIYLRELTKVFPRCQIEGLIQYAIGPFKAKERVEVIRSEKKMFYWVANEAGEKFQVPYGSVKLLGEKGRSIRKVSSREIEDFATLNGVESATDYLVWTDLCRQRIYVLKRKKTGWVLVQNFICSTGKLSHPTPTGFYEVQYNIPYIGVGKGYRCKYALVFFRDYMFHSILFDQSGQYIKSGQYELGSKASHGCIRLSEKDSGWLYSHIPVKTTVWIR